MTTPIVLTWLSYLTPDNNTTRGCNYVKSMKSLIGLQDVNLVLVDNDPTQSLLLDTVRAEIGLGCYESRDKTPQSYQVFRAKNEWVDVAAHYVAYYVARAWNRPYFAYTYDDFVFYDKFWVKDAVSFMDKNPDVCCIRMPRYNAHHKDLFDRDITPKWTNPESVAHHRGGVKNTDVAHSDFEVVGGHEFYKSNWRPQSRPTLWRTDDFARIVGFPNPCPVMQEFEGYMHAFADLDDSYVSGFINRGVCETFSQDTSARLAAGNKFPEVDLTSLEESVRLVYGF